VPARDGSEDFWLEAMEEPEPDANVKPVCATCDNTGEVVCKHDNGITCVRNSREGGPCPHDDPFHGGRCHVPCPDCAEEADRG